MGQNNVVLAGSGDDVITAIGKENWIAAGSGSDIIVTFGKRNIVAADNEIALSTADIGEIKKGTGNLFNEKKKQDDGETKRSDDPAGNELLGQAKLEAEISLSADISILFPEIEFSDPDIPDWKTPELNIPQYDFDIPPIPELKSAPGYVYGSLGNYGLPEIRLPTISTPEIDIPSITLPSLAMPNLNDFGLEVDNFSMDIHYSLDISSGLFGRIDAVAADLFGYTSNDGSNSTIFKSFTEFLPRITPDGAYLNTYSIHTIDVSAAEASAQAYNNAYALDSGSASEGAGNVGASAGEWQSTAGENYNTTPAAEGETQAEKISYTTVALPTIYIPELSVPEFNLNGFDLSGFSVLGSTLGGREFFGFEVPEFTVPEFSIPDFNLGDYIETDALTLAAQELMLPTFSIPNVAGVNCQERIPKLDFDYHLLQENEQGHWGDAMLAFGDTNRLMGGKGDDLTLAFGKENAVFSDQSNDLSLLVGKDNLWRDMSGNNVTLAIGQNNNLFGGIDNDVILAIGAENELSSGSGDNLMAAIGNKNTLKGESGAGATTNNVLFAFGNENEVASGNAAGTLMAIGRSNKVEGLFNDDIAVAVGVENEVSLHKGSDLAFVLGLSNKVIGDTADPFGAGNDVIFGLGVKNYVEVNGGDDGILLAGLMNEAYGGNGDDLIVATGGLSIVAAGNGDDVVANLGAGNAVTGGLGDDFIINLGLGNLTHAGKGDDLVFNLGLAGAAYGDEGADTFLDFGWATMDLLDDAGLGVVSQVLSSLTSALDTVAESFGGSGSEALAEMLSFSDEALNAGGDGNDFFVSGFGDSRAVGGAGEDTYLYTFGSGRLDIEEAANDSDVDTLLLCSNSSQQELLLSMDNLVLSADRSQLDVVLDKQSIGVIGLSNWEDQDLIQLNDGTSSQFSFAELTSYWDELDADTVAQRHDFSAFDSSAALEQGAQATIDWLNSGSGSFGDVEQLNEGAHALVASVVDQLQSTKQQVETAVAAA
nr:calcium-binding protein [Photobacterium sanctipauli]